jgi:hypothetical protein
MPGRRGKLCGNKGTFDGSLLWGSIETISIAAPHLCLNVMRKVQLSDRVPIKWMLFDKGIANKLVSAIEVVGESSNGAFIHLSLRPIYIPVAREFRR